MAEKVVIGNAELWHGDCLELMRGLPDASVDMVLCDLPYGTTRNKWDAVIPFEPLWTEYRRVTRPSAAIVLTANQPFTSALVMSNLDWFKFADVWHKTQARGHLNCKVMPLREHEDILVFCGGKLTYNPQIRPKPKENVRGYSSKKTNTTSYGAFGNGDHRTIPNDMEYPRSVVRVANPNGDERGHHPTQKPVALMEYMIRTYTNQGDTVLDNTMGSGTTGVACLNTGRRFIGIERERKYFDIACERIAKAQAQGQLLPPEPVAAPERQTMEL